MGLLQHIRFSWYQIKRKRNKGMPSRGEVRYWLAHAPVGMISAKWSMLLKLYEGGYCFVEMAALSGMNSIQVRETVKLANQRLIGRKLHMSLTLKKIKKSLRNI